MVKITKEDLHNAVESGILKDEQVDALWDSFTNTTKVNSKFNLTNVIYYFGALLIIFGMGWRMNQAWELLGSRVIFKYGLSYTIFFAGVGYFLYHKKKLEVAGGLLVTAAVCMVPLTTYGFIKLQGMWPEGSSSAYNDYHIWVKQSWLYLEIATIVFAAIMLRFIRFPFLTAPIFFSLWYMSMDLTPLLFGKNEFTMDERKLVSIIFGACVLVLSYLIDKRTKKDFAFWGYLFGMLVFWGGLSYSNSDSELSKFVYFVINVLFIFISVLFNRKIFIICGGIGSFGYLGHLTLKVFANFISFPIGVSIIGLAIIFVGIKYQKNKEKVDERVKSLIPEFILKLAPARRVD
ncbi:hypothetical protein BALOs_0754 [Halobacteriovorax sp. BALOs_7]|uniref:DUF2157 domain-containing protein n=1 Tax=Halobacteriovorax sp. BALOs_7 TaxID=2109558 RepID=UPI000EA2C351|nr:DUF2157 domain-containing protein [Halobacteriovorax sp. BALOs_7]AYF43764.1 hypothetical protein BALOs_0754 [Halobacteriovorax sp. BALOs_7]